MFIRFENNIAKYGMFKKHSNNWVIDYNFYINNTVNIYLFPVPRYQYAVEGENKKKPMELYLVKVFASVVINP